MTYQPPYPTLPPDPAPLPPPNYYAMRAESLWTDDSGAFYVRVDRLGTITWADKDGNSSSEPGTGARPVGSSLALPAGAATDANLTAIAGAAGNSPPALATSASGLLGWLRKIVDTLAGTLSVSAASLPLPTGAATAGNQTTANTSLAQLHVDLTSTLSVLDANNAPFSTATALTVGGAAVAAGKSVGVNCTSAGSMTLSLAGGGSITLPVQVGWATFPFAATGISGATATGTFYNLS